MFVFFVFLSFTIFVRVALKNFENCCRRNFEGSQVSLQFPASCICPGFNPNWYHPPPHHQSTFFLKLPVVLILQSTYSRQMICGYGPRCMCIVWQIIVIHCMCVCVCVSLYLCGFVQFRACRGPAAVAPWLLVLLATNCKSQETSQSARHSDTRPKFTFTLLFNHFPGESDMKQAWQVLIFLGLRGPCVPSSVHPSAVHKKNLNNR